MPSPAGHAAGVAAGVIGSAGAGVPEVGAAADGPTGGIAMPTAEVPGRGVDGPGRAAERSAGTGAVSQGAIGSAGVVAVRPQ